MPDGSLNGLPHADLCGIPFGRVPEPWFCVWSKPMQERVARDNLEALGHETILPLHQVRLPDRHYRIDPLYHRYLFARPNADDQWVPALYARGVSGIIRGSTGRPRAVPHRIIDALRAQCAPDGVIYPPEPRRLKKDDTVRITSGPFIDHLGMFVRSAGARVWALLEVMGAAREIEFGSTAVEAA